MAAPSQHSGGMLGRYRILEQIGAGGMGVVFRARDERLARDVAIKILHPGSIRSSIAKHRVRNEALALSRLNHPNVETIFEFDSHEDSDYLVMEFIPGVSLDELMKAGPLPQAQAISLMVQLLRGLAAAHEKGIIHRDLKPSNLRLTPDGFLKILDFGLAHCADSEVQASEFTTETHSTVLAGTLAYMSPEQLRNAPLDPRCDIYSAGLIFYQMCTGQPCFTESGAVLIDAIFNRPVVSPSKINKQVGSRLAAVILKALEKDANARYQSARDMLRDVEALESAAPATLRARALQAALWIALIAIVICVGAFERSRITGWVDRRIHPVPANRYVAVMPFRSATNDDPAFDQGLTEAVAAKLMEITAFQPVQVVSPRELRTEHVESVVDARNKLGVNLVVEGDLQKVGDVVRLSLELVDAASRRILRGDSVVAHSSDAFALQDQVIEKTVQMLEIEMHQGLGEQGHGTTSAEAFRFYTRGRGFLQDQNSPEDLQSAADQFRQALGIDPGYAEAHASMGLVYLQQYLIDKNPDLVSNSGRECEQAAALNAHLSLAKVCLGKVRLTTGEYEQAAAIFQTALADDPTDDESYRALALSYESLGRNALAEETYRKAISVRPQYATSYVRYGLYLSHQAKYSLAAEQFRIAAKLAPDDGRIWSSLGGVYYLDGKYNQALTTLQHAIELRPSYAAYTNLGHSYFALAKYEDAIVAFEQAVALGSHQIQAHGNLARAYYWYPPKRTESAAEYQKALELVQSELKVNGKDADAHLLAAQYNAMLSRRADALDNLEFAIRARPNDAETLYFAAIIHNQLGDRREALSWLGKAVQRGYSPTEIALTPELNSLKSDPGYLAILGGAVNH